MTIIDIITQLLETLSSFIITPINSVLSVMGYDDNLCNYLITVGFGSVQWFDITINDLIIIVLGLILGFILLRLIYRFIKWLFRLGKGIVGIR